MNILIERIMELSGPMQSPGKHRRYLETLPGRDLQSRLEALQADQIRPRTADGWRNVRIKMEPSKRLEAIRG